ncbi:reverse transcriptase [Caerostris extrusa]|uniref:Reverse transcriptase n=1 Tax=Caerostris extrusa TaxID=172846 RepID=A0AAV4TSX1_CAEEX|nr:reverse transcriptase [Caerostris extrusa]
MNEIEENVEPVVSCYLLHRGIYWPQNSTTKLRTVFNVSTVNTSRKSLNSTHYNGGVIQDYLFSLLVISCKHIYTSTRHSSNASKDKY